MVDFNFRTWNVESLAQKNKEEARQVLKQLREARNLEASLI